MGGRGEGTQPTATGRNQTPASEVADPDSVYNSLNSVLLTKEQALGTGTNIVPCSLGIEHRVIWSHWPVKDLV